VKDMHLSAKNQYLLKLYSLAWGVTIPGLYVSPRIRAGWRERLLKGKPGNQVDVWMQASSGGEAYLALEILSTLAVDPFPDVLVTSGTTQGLDILKKGIEGIDQSRRESIRIVSFPFDCPGLMERAVRQWKPRVMVLLETELWPGLMAACVRQRVPIVILNGRLSRKSFKTYRWLSGFWRNVRPERILAVSRGDRDRYFALFGDQGVQIMHNIKFDRMQLDGIIGRNPISEMVPEGASFLVMGSVRKDEEKDVLNVLVPVAKALPETISAIFPRHMQRIPAWKRSLDRAGSRWFLRSEITGPVPAGSVILWDVFGELSSAYAVAQAAFVGGTLRPLGGQNFLEPLGQGVVPCIGPYWEHFAWVGEDIVARGLVSQVANHRQLTDCLVRNLRKPLPRAEVLEMARDYVNKRRGGTETACRTIKEFLSEG
jgi:3-deoxy-D-manno-octulosonic-acid transferase